jgi:predicted transposase/invertase (TIGR01784 family)
MTTDLSNPHDRFFKEIWSRKRVSRDFLRHYLPAAVVALLDLNTLELTKDSFIDQRLREYYSDLLYRVQLKDGTAAFVYLLLEHKRRAERLTVVQVLRYIVQIWESPLAQIEGKTVLPPVIPMVVYHGDQPWPYGQSLHAILALPAELTPYVPEFRYELCDLAGLADADIKGAVLLRVALLVMKHIADPRLAEQLPEIFGLLRTLAEKPTALGYLETLLRYLAAAATRLTEPDIQQALAEILPTLEEKLMPTIAETWLERGRAEGRVEGRVEGRTEGRLEAERYILIHLLEKRFGPLPAPYRVCIAAADSETLLHWSEQVLSAQQLQDIFEALQ